MHCLPLLHQSQMGLSATFSIRALWGPNVRNCHKVGCKRLGVPSPMAGPPRIIPPIFLSICCRIRIKKGPETTKRPSRFDSGSRKCRHRGFWESSFACQVQGVDIINLHCIYSDGMGPLLPLSSDEAQNPCLACFRFHLDDFFFFFLEKKIKIKIALSRHSLS
jgi:hypothetical protein